MATAEFAERRQTQYFWIFLVFHVFCISVSRDRSVAKCLAQGPQQLSAQALRRPDRLWGKQNHNQSLGNVR